MWQPDFGNHDNGYPSPIVVAIINVYFSFASALPICCVLVIFMDRHLLTMNLGVVVRRLVHCVQHDIGTCGMNREAIILFMFF